jgi:hypothetical protein
MSNVSKYLKVDKNVLIEYVYNKSNLVIEPYNILVNSRERKQSYVAVDSTGTGNSLQNQLFRIDPIQNKYGKVNTNFYSFLQVKNFGSSIPLRHDTIKVHIPINWTFGEYLGFYIRVWTFDSSNRNQIELSNFYFDMSDVNQQYLLNFTSPPLLFQEKLWGKSINIEVPAVSEVSSQLTNNRPTENSLNSNLTNGIGLSLNSPIFIDFSFINSSQVINGIVNYILSTPVTTSVAQTPDFEKLGLKIENSLNGDFFEIYGTYNETIAEFKKFIDDSVSLGNRYYVQYNITLFEQNIRGKKITVTVTDSFNESIEFRPIIKYSTTTAIIDVEMRLIDAVDDSYIIRRASYGMLQDEVSKYSLNLMKINLKNASKPKIYNIKSAINPDLVGIANSMGIIPINNNPKKPKMDRNLTNPLIINNNNNGVVIEQIKVPFPVLVERFNVMAKSDNAVLDTKTFFGFGKIQILLYPFDNIVKFSIATGSADSPRYLDLTGYSEIKFVIKNDSNTISFDPFIESGEIDLVNGGLAFKISESKFQEIKKIYNDGINVFYITGTNLSTTSVVYTGLFKIFDDRNNVEELNQIASNPEIILDPTPIKPVAVVTRRPIDVQLESEQEEKIELVEEIVEVESDVIVVNPQPTILPINTPSILTPPKKKKKGLLRKIKKIIKK